jgi:hypothetical protein
MHDYQWSIDGEKRIPTPEEIESAVEEAKGRLTEVGGGTLMVGHLVIAKMDADKEEYDIYVHQGTLGE